MKNTEKILNIAEEEILREILKNFEEIVEENKTRIEAEIKENGEKLTKVKKREQLRKAKRKIKKVYENTKNYKGKEGITLRDNIKQAIKDIDEQIDELVTQTTVNSHEITDVQINNEIERLLWKKEKLESTLNRMKDKYSDKKIKEYKKEKCKKEFSKEISQTIENIKRRITVEELINIGKKINNRLEEQNEKEFTESEITSILRNITVDKSRITAEDIKNLKFLDKYRKDYIKQTREIHRRDISELDKKSAEQMAKFYKDRFIEFNNIVKELTGEELMPIKSEQEYDLDLKMLLEKTEKIRRRSLGRKKANKINLEMHKLRKVFEVILDATEDKGKKLKMEYNNIIDELNRNTTLRYVKIPGKFNIKSEKRSVVDKVKTEKISEEFWKKNNVDQKEEMEIDK